MSRHLWVNPGRLDKGWATRVVDGVALTVEISPYSVPKAVVCDYDKKKECLTIDFKYIDNEESAKPPRDLGGVSILEGKHSGKILKISISVDLSSLKKLGPTTIRTKIVNAFRERIPVISDPEAPGEPDVLNQEVAEEILDLKTLTELTKDLGLTKDRAR